MTKRDKELTKKISKRISIGDIDPIFLYGHHDCNLARLEERFGVKVIARGEHITFQGEDENVQRVSGLFSLLLERIHHGYDPNNLDLVSTLECLDSSTSAQVDLDEKKRLSEPAVMSSSVILASNRKVIRTKTPGQQDYVMAIREYDVVFSIGPAGTGKTYLAVAMALAALKSKEVDRIILVRPAVEAGESLGFLPGDMENKVDPYLRPLYDALYDMLSTEKLRRLLDMRTIEIAPLAYMRGRTLNQSFVILDEAQNTTTNQMKMFLTRLGIGSKAVVNGDITQIDLPDPKASGLIQIQHILFGVKGIKFVYLTEKDVVRHRLVRDIIKAYDQRENSNGQRNGQMPLNPETPER
ncbi:MAG: PhoH family protein [Candidatus Latescibacteria bacterium]|nr:PhoH family protein [Candidatus Latescibacterota bacterium]